MKFYSITLFFIVTTMVQLFSMSPAFAAVAPNPTPTATQYSKQSYSNQLKIIKLFAGFYECINGADGQHTKLKYNISANDIATGNWFDNSQKVKVGLGDTTGTDGSEDCNDIITAAMTNKSVFGFSSYTAASTALKINDNNGTLDDVIDGLSKQIFGGTIGGDSDSTIDSFLSGVYGTNGMRYYDLYNTAVKKCSAKEVTNTVDNKNKAGNYPIYFISPTGTVSSQLWNFQNLGDKIPYGWSIDSQESGGIGRQISCKDIARKLGQKSYADEYGNYIVAHQGNEPTSPGDGPGGSTPSTCNIDGIGWIVCPVLSFMGNIVDQSYAVVNSMLTINAFTGNANTNTELKGAWGSMRNIANVVFVIAFLFIIYSQVTGFGVSNYGIKKMLPRIIVAAILVNVSYWLCAIAVDLSNLLGSSMKEIFNGLGTGDTFAAKTQSWSKGGTGWTGIVGGVVAASTATAAALYIGLAALVPALVAALIAIVTVMLVLVLRQALIVLLIVVSPLAFVAFLLPNTQQWFKKWRELFQILLLMYPIIGIIFGASALASQIVMNSATGSEPQAIAIQVMGAAIAIIPLFITPIVMKTAGGVLNTFAGKINNPNKGPFDRMRKGADGFRDSSKSAMRARRINSGDGKTGVSRTWRRAAGLSTRTGVRMKAGADKNKAAESSAEAGLLMTNKNAIEASRLNMAESTAKSALQSQAIQGIDDRQDKQLAAIGQSRNKDGTIHGVTPEADVALRAGMRSQISQGEKQAIQERESLIAAQDVAQLGKTMEAAIKGGDKFTVLAAQNKLSGMGNAGIDKIADVIEKRETAASSGESNGNWDEVRTEMARSMGPIMGKNESLKKWATSTSRDEKGRLNSDQSLADIRREVLSSGGAASGMSVDKLAQQTPKALLEMLGAHSISKDTIATALNERNVGSFNKAVVVEMKNQIGGTTTQSTNNTNQSNGSTPGTGPNHGYL